MQITAEDRQRIARLIADYLSHYDARLHAANTISADAEAALNTYPPEVVRMVAEEMLADADADERFMGGRMLLVIDRQTYLPRVLTLLQDPDTDVRGSFATILGGYRDRWAVPALLHLLQHDPNPTNRVAAAEAVGYIGDPAALPALQWATEHDTGIGWEDVAVADAAARANAMLAR